MSAQPDLPGLLPCPFCGGEAAVNTRTTSDPEFIRLNGRDTGYAVNCIMCGVNTRGITDMGAATHEAAIARWNRRAGTDAMSHHALSAAFALRAAPGATSEKAPDDLPGMILQDYARAAKARTHPAPAASEGDWPEDAHYENGQYTCVCCHCGKHFVGHKRRVTCKACATPTTPAPATRGEWDAEKVHARADEIERAIAEGRMGAASVFTQMRQLLPKRAPKQDSVGVGEIVRAALLSHYCHDTVDEDGNPLPLVDKLTPEGDDSIKRGQDEIERIVDALTAALGQAGGG